MAESLEKIYNRFKMAEEIAVYQKADSGMRLPTQQEYNQLPAEIKAQYPNYGLYIAAMKIQINMQKAAMRAKLDALKTAVGAMGCFDAAEKSQYGNEIDTAKTNIKDINGK